MAPTWRVKIYGRAPDTEHGRRKLHKGDYRIQGGVLDAFAAVTKLLRDAPDVDDLLDRVVVQRDRI